MNTYTATNDTDALLKDASRPFLVVCTGSKGSHRIMSRYQTMAQATRRARDLTNKREV